MCLIVKVSEEGLEEGKIIPVKYIKESDGRITCYKIVRKVGKKYITPFQETKINWPTMHGITRFKAKGEKMDDEHHLVYGGEMAVYSGVIHSMRRLKDAEGFTDYIRNNSEWEIEIWECVIPRGVKYMEGEDSNGCACYGSESIRFVKKVEEKYLKEWDSDSRRVPRPVL